MMKTYRLYLLFLSCILAGSISAQTNLTDSIAPDSTGMSSLHSAEFSKKFGRGWNLGNSLEAIGGETIWGNPKTTQRLIDSIKAAGFNTIRIPVAWSVFSDKTNYIIGSVWMARVEKVVNYALKDSMYVLLNEHWDGGWLQPTYAKQAEANKRLAAIWKQIALHFRDYDDHLLFAGTNEVMVEGDYGAPTKEYYTVQNGYNQLFINTVRATGGRNTFRYLAVQGFNTNINYTLSYFTLPKDVVNDKLMLEVHYYDPYNFTINSNSTLYVWGKDAPKSESWANESYADGQFKKLKTNFIDKNIGVLIGEYAASSRLNLGDSLNAMYAQYRLYYLQYITRSMVRNGLIPYYWDIGVTGNNASGLFNRNTGAHAYPEIINALIDTNNVKAPVIKVDTTNVNKPSTNVHDLKDQLLKLYPNPVTNMVHLELTSETAGLSKLYNTTGQVVRTICIKNGFNSIDVTELKTGLYFIQIPLSNKVLTQNFFKE